MQDKGLFGAIDRVTFFGSKNTSQGQEHIDLFYFLNLAGLFPGAI